MSAWRIRARFLLDLLRFRPRSQSNEDALLADLARLPIPRTFLEIGFSPLEFNCGGLIRLGFSGVLVDGNGGRAVRLMRLRAPRRIRIVERFLTLENIGFLLDLFRPRELGVLSVDVDGNDYWFLEALLPLEPAVIVVEYNAAFGLRRITVPYDPGFDRFEKHPSGCYHGASLTALASLCRGYRLVAVSDAGLNAIFLRDDFAADPLEPAAAIRENEVKNARLGAGAEAQWAIVSELPFVRL